MKDIILTELNKYPNVFSYSETNSKVYLFNSIPSKFDFKAKNIRGLPLKSEILWFSDLTFWGSGEDNTIITEEGIFYFETTFGEKSILNIYWDKLIKVEYIDGNESFYFIYSEEFENMNFFLPKSNFILGLESHKIPTVLIALNNICSSAEDKETILINQLIDADSKEDHETVHRISDMLLENYPNSQYKANFAKAKAYFKTEEWDNSLYYQNFLFECFKENEKLRFDFRSDFMVFNEIRAVTLDNLGKKNQSLIHFNVLNGLVSDFQKKQNLNKKINELKVSLKEEFVKYPIESKKFVVIDSSEMDLSEDKVIKVLPKDHMPNLKFPISHPNEQTLYAVHPYKENLYFPIIDLDDILFRERIDEFLNFVRCLGAVKINIEFKKGTKINSIEEIEKNLKSKAGREIKGIGYGLDVKQGIENKFSNSNSEDSALKISQSFPSPKQPPFLPEELLWFNHEPSWQNLYVMRKNGGLLEHKETLTSKEVKKFYSRNEKKLNAEIKALALNSKLESNTQEIVQSSLSEETVWDITIQFENFSEKAEDSKIESLDLSDSEKEYIEEFKFILSEYEKIDISSRKLLNRLANKLNISEERKNFIENSILMKFTNEEELYLSELEFCLSETSEITSIERRFLERERVKLNLTKERADYLEDLVKAKIENSQ